MGDLDNLNFPRMIGRYQVLRLLGSGAMGSVVLAEDPRIKRKVAIKLMKLDAVRTEADQHEYLARFQREAEVSGLLNHPGIVAIYDVGEVEGHGPFLAMEYVAGRPLDGIMKAGPALTMKEKFKIIVGLAEALDHAHAKAIVHRDVKPGNVMVSEDGRPKLMDFGIAKREDASLTQTGTFLGTPSYASPEQIKEGTVDNRSDIFSFGVLVFELMSGQSPFPGSSINTILYRIVNEPPVEVHPPVVGMLPDGWRRVFERVLAKRPEQRHPTCTAFTRELLDAVVELGKEDRREILGLMRMSGEAPLPEIVSTSFDETMVVARPESKSLGWPWIAALTLVAAVGLSWFFFRGPKGTRLQIDSQPAGAKVFVNDLAVGTTPMNQALVTGDKLRLELKGHRPVTYEIKAGEAPRAFPLQPVLTDELIDSTPKGATVVLDEKPLEGVTPLTVRWNQGQPHRLTLTKDKLGHASDFGPGEVPGGRVFELKEATTAETRQEPALNPHEPGALKLSGGFSVRVKAAGKDLGELSPGAKLPLPPGTHQLELISARHFYKDVRAVTVTAGQTVTLTVPGLANLTVNTFPGSGKVFVDGQDTGTESDGSSPIQVALGRHTITVRGPKGTKTETVDMTGDKLLSFQL
ncbi:MAG: serine/threonine protein kinase [Geothrix sp.]|uniref:serine/threonine-protein kinase n=1 Tax=Geothrix sp. TaxID=1962974 RepID=UPI00185780B8|nr:serine/threonine-protein kinase [Geothrix sp.]NWJ39539.1 serine/threonine protein kinase [Geothrix sp.]WIL19240.1 MAG: protein kinase [Geothrix sp.]